MNAVDMNPKDDVLLMIYLRNEFYKKKFYLVLSVYVLSFIVILFLIGVLHYLTKHPTRPLYFVTDKVGRFIQDIPVTSPNMSDDEVGSWAVEAIESAYSYDFVNFRTQLQNAQKYFTDYGWRKYMEGLTLSNNLLGLQQRKYVAIAKVVDKPKLLGVGIVGGAYAWRFQLSVLVTYLSPPYDNSEKSKFSNPLVVTTVIQRQSILTSYRGLGIVQLIANFASVPSQNLNLAPNS